VGNVRECPDVIQIMYLHFGHLSHNLTVYFFTLHCGIVPIHTLTTYAVSFDLTDRSLI